MAKQLKIVVSPAYREMKEEFRKIPAGIYRIRRIHCDRRNTVCEIETESGRPLVLKRYKRPTLFNRLIYTLFRKSKARRAYEYAFRLQRMGFETAAPAGYLKERRWGFFHTDYFLSQVVPHPLLSSLEKDQPEYREIFEAFAACMVRMHRAGILNLDMNPGNVFYYKEQGRYRFVLIDINRIRFRRRLTRNDCIEVFKHLDNLAPEALLIILTHYARLRGWNARLLSGAVLLRQGIDRPRRIKYGLRSFFRRRPQRNG